MAKLKPEQELEILFPEREFKCSLGTITVNPFKFGQFPQVLKIVNKYVEFFGNQDVIVDILNSGEAALDDLAQLANFSAGITRETLDEMSGDEALDLFFKIFEVNADFFIQKTKLGAEKLVARIQKAGA